MASGHSSAAVSTSGSERSGGVWRWRSIVLLVVLLLIAADRETADTTKDRVDNQLAGHVFGYEPCDSLARAGVLGSRTFPKF